jgi:hypothetical protein
MSNAARADLVLTGLTPARSFVDLGAQGFGNAPRLLTEQTNTFESGSVTPINITSGDAVSGSNTSSTPTLPWRDAVESSSPKGLSPLSSVRRRAYKRAGLSTVSTLLL